MVICSSTRSEGKSGTKNRIMKRRSYAILVSLALWPLLGRTQVIKATLPAVYAEQQEQAKVSGVLQAMPEDRSPRTADLDWLPTLVRAPRIRPELSRDPERLEAIKEAKWATKQQSRLEKNWLEPASTSGILPVLGRNFRGNGNDGFAPLDNHLAISNSGWIVSVINANIQYFNVSGQRTYSNSIAAFFNFQGIEDICDPLVLYDSEADRFIFFAMECSGVPANSTLLIAFSKAANPGLGWWVYRLSGNPRNNNTWFDYPKMAVTNNELIITGNSYQDEDFMESLIYQIPKANGYAGAKLNYQYWHALPGNPFTLMPVGYGRQGNYGPGVYLVASESEGASHIHFYDLTDDMSASNERIDYYKIPVPAYSPVPSAGQRGTTRLLDNGDCRMLSGFYQDTLIHMVFHTDQGDSWNGVNYLRLHTVRRTVASSTFGLAGSYDYSYPAIASLSNGPGDQTVAIGFCRSSDAIFPEYRVVTCDQAMNWSSSILVKGGLGYVDYAASGKESERWGDYSGIARWYGAATPTVWVAGSYGSLTHDWETWLAEVVRTGTTPARVLVRDEAAFHVFPNPVYEGFRTRVQLDASCDLRMTLYTSDGKLLKELYRGWTSSGEHIFSFNQGALTPGTYILTLEANGLWLRSEKLLIAH